MTSWPGRRTVCSQAILIGTAAYENLPSIPAARNSLAKMYDLLTSDLCAWHKSQVIVIENPREPTGIARRLVDSYGQATDVALFYYVGHGNRDNENKLSLGLVDSRVGEAYTASTSLQFNAVRQALRASRAAVKIVMLDCCHSGLSGNENDIVRGMEGAYLVAATKQSGRAKFDTAHGGLTYFTRHFAAVIEQGIANGSEALTLDEIVAQTRTSLAAADLPVPTDVRIDLHGYPFARNQAFRSRQPRTRGEHWRMHDIPPPPHQGKITCMAMSPAPDLLATGGADGTVALHKIASDDTCSVTKRLGMSNEDRKAETATNKAILRENYGWGAMIADLHLNHRRTITGLAFYPASIQSAELLAVSGGRHGLKIWRSGEKNVDVGLIEDRHVLPTFSSDGKFLVSAKQAILRDTSWLQWWDDAGKVGSNRVDALGMVNAIAPMPISSNSSFVNHAAEDIFACGYHNGVVRFWSFESAIPVGPPLHADAGVPIRTLAFHPQGRFLATANREGLLSIWSIADFGERLFIGSQSGDISSVSACRLPLQRRLSGASAGISAVAYSPDGFWLATGHWDGNVRLWNPESGTETDRGLIHSLETAPTKAENARMITSLIFTPDTRLLIAANANGQMFVWRRA